MKNATGVYLEFCIFDLVLNTIFGLLLASPSQNRRETLNRAKTSLNIVNGVLSLSHFVQPYDRTDFGPARKVKYDFKRLKREVNKVS